MKKIIFAFALAILLVFSISCTRTDEPVDDNIKSRELSIPEKSIELKIGETYTVNVQDVTAEYLFFESSDLNIASVDAEGQVKAKAEGTATITISLLNDDSVNVKLTVTVKKQQEEFKTIDTLSINGGSELYVGSTITLLAVYDKEIDVNLTWSSSNPDVVLCEYGVITALEEGTATITLKDEISGLVTQKVITVLHLETEDEVLSEILDWAVATVGDSGCNEIYLPKTDPSHPGSVITWESADSVLIDVEEGLLDINNYDQTCDLTCTVEYKGKTVSKTYTYTITSYVLYEMYQKFLSQFKNLSVYHDMNVNSTYSNYGGTTISWNSLDKSIFDNTGKYTTPFNDEDFDIEFTITTTSPALSRKYTVTLTGVGMNIGDKAQYIADWAKENVGDAGYLSQTTLLPEYIEDFKASIEWYSSNGSLLDLSVLAGNPILSSGTIEVIMKVTVNGESDKVKATFLTKSVEYSDIWDQIKLFFDTINTTNIEQFKYVLVSWTGSSYGYVPFITNNRIAITEDILPYTYGKQRTGIVKTSTEYIVCHDTGNASNGANAEMHRRYITNLNNSSDSTSISWHFTIDETQCIQHLPLNEVAWHAGDGSRAYGTTYHNDTYNADSHGGGNMNGIGIESCIHNGTDYTHTMLRYAKLVAGLCVDFHLGTDRVHQHNYFSGKDCPWVMRNNNRWDEFMFLIKLEYYAMTALKDVKLEWTSLSPEVDSEGRLFSNYDAGTKFMFQLKATYKGETRTYTGDSTVVKR